MFPRVLHRAQCALSSPSFSLGSSSRKVALLHHPFRQPGQFGAAPHFVRFNVTAASAAPGQQQQQPPPQQSSTKSTYGEDTKKDEKSGGEQGFPFNPDAHMMTLKDIVESTINEATSKLNLKVPLDDLTSNLQAVGAGGFEKSSKQMVSIMSVFLLLNRGHVLSDAEIDEHLGDMLPQKIIELVKEKKSMLPPDPMMEQLKELGEKLTKIEATLGKLEQTLAKVAK